MKTVGSLGISILASAACWAYCFSLNINPIWCPTLGLGLSYVQTNASDGSNFGFGKGREEPAYDLFLASW
jgi:hypothetical protein